MFLLTAIWCRELAGAALFKTLEAAQAYADNYTRSHLETDDEHLEWHLFTYDNGDKEWSAGVWIGGADNRQWEITEVRIGEIGPLREVDFLDSARLY